MRRAEKAVTDRREIDAIIDEAKVCRLAMCDGPTPYLVTMCFGYDGAALHFHCATEGRKLDILKRNAKVCFEMDILDELVTDAKPCGWTMIYRSVVGSGLAELVADPAEKARSLDIIMRHYDGPTGDYPEAMLDRVAIIRVAIEEISGKRKA